MPQHTYLTDNLNGPISNVTLNDGDASANIPLKQYAFYVQDDWALTGKLTLNVGLRYDLIDGYQFDQSKNPNFVIVQEAGRAGQLAGIKGLENFGLDPKNDTNNWQPRIGFAYDLRGDGKDVIRGGWGIYMDMAYTNSNALFAAMRRHRRWLRCRAVGGQPVRHPQPGRQLLPGRPAALEHPSQNQVEPERVAAVRPVDRSAPADAVHAADVGRLVAPADAKHGDHRRLRPRRRPRPERPSAHQHRASSPDGAARACTFLGPAAQRHRHPAGHQPRREQVHRPHHSASSAA